MGALALLASGCLCGIAAAAPLVVALGRPRPRMALGVAGVLGGFLAMQLVLLGVRQAWPDLLVPFGTLAVMSFLATTVAVALRRRGTGR